jgi:lipoprotein-anchoring transpeptidase ErfK/SrfK
VIAKDKDHRSSLYKVKGKGAPMPFYVNFAPAVGFHAGSLSTPSHGCVHLSASDAETFFNNLDVGDRVDVIE